MIENELLYVFPGEMVLGFHLNLVDLYLHLLRLRLLYRIARGRIRERLLAAAATSTTSAATSSTARLGRLLRRDHLPRRLRLTTARWLPRGRDTDYDAPRDLNDRSPPTLIH